LPLWALAQAQTEITDETIFNFALNLEYLESEYYLRGLTGQGLTAEDIGVQHREHLGAAAVDRPAIDLAGGFAAVGEAAGLGAGFDPFADEISFFLGGMLFEDVGVTGYKGATPLIQDKKFQEDIAGILAVEAYHMGMARSVIYQAGVDAQAAANAITEARGVLNGNPDIEQGVEVNEEANVVPSDEFGIAFSRTPNQVLQIVYLTPEKGVTSGGFFPNGFNGELKMT
jgi:hypothetical protein